MSNHHQTNHLKGVSLSYMEEEFPKTTQCKRKQYRGGFCEQCKGTCTEVWVRYYPEGPICKELECTTCQKVYRDNNKQKYFKPYKKKWRKK